ncbi:hypothetical protein [Rosenbergiella epipactidis]|uniref:hypothetical protein n=1 Tax=Rosenbergiella epipactidis TaxID=1544694 RepID=UPI0006645560|nr:hypothetical protein [Rosenbergiella epipactidis]KMV67207.1 hypothetical protein AI29_14650 [bacteria symbiont BFo2 of Frankliniella occidentalis]KYP88244.1 hypothetical protein WB60_10390 [bacteria symbiont BFo2 of Frankliniella occidentalis]KYP95250.1 hypothetical protein WB67_06805 [bacteria symbiont BFo2 of Frankliniella occidentalis]
MISLLKKIIVGTTLSLSLSTLCSASDYVFNVQGRSDIEQEISVAKILPFYQYLHGEIEIQWANPELLSSVKRLASLLEKEGVREQDIVRNFSQSMAYKNHTRDSITLVLKTSKTSTHCAPYNLRSSFKALGEESCAINDNLDAMKIRK